MSHHILIFSLCHDYTSRDLGPARGDGGTGSRGSAGRGGESIGDRREGGRTLLAFCYEIALIYI